MIIFLGVWLLVCWDGSSLGRIYDELILCWDGVGGIEDFSILVFDKGRGLFSYCIFYTLYSR